MAGITEELQREIDAWCSPEARGWITPSEMIARLPAHVPFKWDVAPPQEEIANLKGELESARYEAAHARKLAATVKAERDAAIYERNIAIQSLAELIQHFINAPAPAEEDPAVRAVRVMQKIGAAR